MGKWSFLIDDISPSSLEINRSESCVILFFNVKISIDWWSLYTERELDKNPSGHITCVEALSANHISCSKAQHSTNIHLHKSSLVFCPSILHIWDCCDKLLFWTSLWVFYLAVQLTEIRKHPYVWMKQTCKEEKLICTWCYKTWNMDVNMYEPMECDKIHYNLFTPAI